MYAPTDIGDLTEIVIEAAAAGQRLEIRGGGGKAAFGCDRLGASILDMRAFNTIFDYDPAELTLRAGAGAPLAEIQTLVTAQGQMLAFEPWDQASLYGGSAGVGTIGGALAAGATGPRRLSRGGPRDHLLGFEAVSGRGERFIAGGNVVKNVTGFDLSKLVCGSWGRLAALTQVTVKVLPAPRSVESFALDGLAPDIAQAALNAAMKSQADIAAAAYLPGSESLTVFRLEGVEPSIRARADLLSNLLEPFGAIRPMDAQEAVLFWTATRDVSALSTARILWRLSLPPSRGAAVARELCGADANWLMDCAGGLVWIPGIESAARVRDTAAKAGGHATLIRAPAAMRALVPALHPTSAGVARIEHAVRAAFDPAGVFETGRFLDMSRAD
jgi:glycolate oxidase FAD binding subunit